MKGERRVKKHIISLRISAEEWDSLNEIMKGLQFKRVSDLMREAFKLVLAPPNSFGDAAAEGQKRIG
jgi:hypothetical protein